MADAAGFETAWAAEHHGIELNIGPNPFVTLANWAAYAPRIRLGTAVVVAPYWHPIRLAEEAALADLLSGGRLELGIGRGAFQYEFDRMGGGLSASDTSQYLHAIVAELKALWSGDVESNTELWRYERTTSVPKPVAETAPAAVDCCAQSHQLRLCHGTWREHHDHAVGEPVQRSGCVG